MAGTVPVSGGTGAAPVHYDTETWARRPCHAELRTQQVGYGYVEAQRVNHALLWAGSPQSVVDLHPAGYENSWARAVAAGQQVGQADSHAMLWHGTAASAVDVNPQGYGGSELVDTNGRQQVGYALSDNRVHAALWDGTPNIVDLHPAGYVNSYVWGLNDSQQAGHGELPDRGTHALLWSGTRESVIDLHPFVPPEFPWSAALAVDDQGNVYGEVAGLAANPAVSYPAVWLVPEPAAAASLLPLCLGMLLRRRVSGSRFDK